MLSLLLSGDIGRWAPDGSRRRWPVQCKMDAGGGTWHLFAHGESERGMPMVDILSTTHFPAAERARIEAVDPGVRLVDAAGWFDGEFRETWPAYAASRYV